MRTPTSVLTRMVPSAGAWIKVAFAIRNPKSTHPRPIAPPPTPTPLHPTLHPRCTVRGCGRELSLGASAWTCASGHAYDLARSGYVNLLQPGDRRSRAPGDARACVAARWRLEERGIGLELVAAVQEQVRALDPRPGDSALDAGAGTGRLLERLACAFGLEGWALDISVPAVEAGARRRPRLAWVVANADRRLPFEDGCFALVLCSTGPKNPEEFRRVLAPAGSLLLIVPAADDLIELRAALQGEGRLEPRADRALARFEGAFECASRSVVRTTRKLGHAAIEDLLAVSYRGARASQRAARGELHELETTMAWEVLRLVPRPSDP